jgi:hypothetical protein
MMSVEAASFHDSMDTVSLEATLDSHFINPWDVRSSGILRSVER